MREVVLFVCFLTCTDFDIMSDHNYVSFLFGYFEGIFHNKQIEK